MTMYCFNCGEPLDVAIAYMVIPYVGERYGWYCNEDCYKEYEDAEKTKVIRPGREDNKEGRHRSNERAGY